MGSVLTGTIFDNTKKRGKPVAFQVGKTQVIPGLEQGMIGMKVSPAQKERKEPSCAYVFLGSSAAVCWICACSLRLSLRVRPAGRGGAAAVRASQARVRLKGSVPRGQGLSRAP